MNKQLFPHISPLRCVERRIAAISTIFDLHTFQVSRHVIPHHLQNIDGFVKNPSAALHCILPRVKHGAGYAAYP
jgi:hypothetical protein